MFKLINSFQTYKWGCVGQDSLVSKYVSNQNTQIEDDKEYAEYWLGTHVNGPSYIIKDDNQVLLKDYINKDLPFLFKILSINKPLSIQIHPDQLRAESLNLKYPEKYKDKNKKPELAIALSDNFEMFYGVLPLIKVKQFLETNADFVKLLEEQVKISISFEFLDLDQYLRLLILILNLSKESVKSIISSMLENKILYNHVYSLFQEFSFDLGIIFSLFMNRIKLNKNECLFINENIPHSYIKGNIIECMANSDFVIRIGLTPKEIDIENFTEILENNFNDLLKTNDSNNTSIQISKGVDLYEDQKIKDFVVYKYTEKSNKLKFTNHSILLITEGKNIKLELNGKVIIANQYDSYFIEKESQVGYSTDDSNEISIFIATNN